MMNIPYMLLHLLFVLLVNLNLLGYEKPAKVFHVYTWNTMRIMGCHKLSTHNILIFEKQALKSTKKDNKINHLFDKSFTFKAPFLSSTLATESWRTFCGKAGQGVWCSYLASDRNRSWPHSLQTYLPESRNILSWTKIDR